jgi:hypothetical protein
VVISDAKVGSRKGTTTLNIKKHEDRSKCLIVLIEHIQGKGTEPTLICIYEFNGNSINRSSEKGTSKEGGFAR